MVINRTNAKGQGYRSFGSKVTVKTDRRTDGGDCITSGANAVGNNTVKDNESALIQPALIIKEDCSLLNECKRSV